MSQFTQPEEWSILLNALADDELTSEQERRLIELMQADVEFRREYVRFCQLLTQLHWQHDIEPDALPASDNLMAPVRSSRSKRHWWQASLALVLLLTVVVGWLNWNEPVEEAPGQLVRVSGRVGLFRDKQPPLWIAPDELFSQSPPLKRGDRLQTGRNSAATLELADQTRIQIRPETEVVIRPAPDGGIGVPAGSISAKVTPQNTGQPLIFSLPNAEVMVLGTELELLSSPGQSEVAVLEGKVQVTRLADDSKRAVSAGQFLPVTESGPLSVVDWPRPADEWSVDFEHGLPAGWEGQRMTQGLPNQSRGGVRSIPDLQGQQTVQKLQSPLDPSGLFFWHDDSLLHLTFKIQPPGWFHIYLLARTYQESRPVLTYCYVDLSLWQTQPGEWRTVSIPLSEFRLQNYAQDNPVLGRIPLQISFRGESETDGFMIDRIWVTRGAPPSPAGHTDIPATNDMR